MSLRSVRNLALLLLLPLAAGYLVIQNAQSRQTIFSRWGVVFSNDMAAPLISKARPLSGAAERIPSAAELLEAYSAGSQLQESVADNALRYYRRPMPGGELSYFVITLSDRIHVEVINADGATPGSDAGGDTIWTDGQQHLASVAEMAGASYAQRDGLELIAAMAFGFHGAERTSDEGSVVINGTVHRVNAGRAALCIDKDGRARIGLFDATELQGCQQAIGAGPVILLNGKIASTEVSAENDEYVPFNPLGEDFIQLDWRKTVYNGLYPKTVAGVGELPDGRSFLVLLISNGVSGVDIARALRDMGVRDALGGDDDSSTQATWRGQNIWGRAGREVPDAIGVYVRP